MRLALLIIVAAVFVSLAVAAVALTHVGTGQAATPPGWKWGDGTDA